MAKGYRVEEIFDTVDIRAYSVPVDAGDTQVVNMGDLIYLACTPAQDYYWYADHAMQISSRSTRTTTAKLANTRDTLIKFFVKVTDTRGCQGLDSTYVIIRRDAARAYDHFISPMTMVKMTTCTRSRRNKKVKTVVSAFLIVSRPIWLCQKLIGVALITRGGRCRMALIITLCIAA
ncbi:MAG: hypothetical protein U5L96_11465 [Owenweeksia sp.]|nr:hypothetical protein [Owenweeksia sp.]